MVHESKTVWVVGAGYVGVCTAAGLAHRGHNVVLLETNPDRRQVLQEGILPFHEPGLDELLQTGIEQGRIRVADPGDLESLELEPSHPFDHASARMAIYCVGTPSLSDGQADLSFLQHAVQELTLRVQGLVATGRMPRDVSFTHVVKSTVPPGTTQTVVLDWVHGVLEETDASTVTFQTASHPEFLREGLAVQDTLHPDRIVIGGSEAAVAQVAQLYEGCACPIETMDATSSEWSKLAANVLLAGRIALANELANLVMEQGGNWDHVVRGLGHDRRIGPLFLKPGAGFGGSCFPKDVRSAAAMLRLQGFDAPMTHAILAQNAYQPQRVVSLLEREIGPLQGRRIALLGLTFKGNTDDVRETRALPIYQYLKARGATVICYDPQPQHFPKLAPDATIASSRMQALHQADGCIVQADWAEFKTFEEREIHAMRTPTFIDARGIVERAPGGRIVRIGHPLPALDLEVPCASS